MILLQRGVCKKAIDKQVIFPGHSGRPADAHIYCGEGVLLVKRCSRNLRNIKQILKNSTALANALKTRAFAPVSGGTDNHLMPLDLRSVNITGKELEHRLTRSVLQQTRTQYQMILSARLSQAVCASELRQLQPAGLRRPTAKFLQGLSGLRRLISSQAGIILFRKLTESVQNTHCIDEYILSEVCLEIVPAIS